MNKLTTTVIVVGLALYGCDTFTNEGYRTQQSFDKSLRGVEEYQIQNMDSLQSAFRLNEHLNKVFAESTKIDYCTDYKTPEDFARCMAVGVQPSYPKPDDSTPKTIQAPNSAKLNDSIPVVQSPNSGIRNHFDEGIYQYNLKKFWDTDVLKNAIDKTSGDSTTALVKEMNHVLWMQYVRDMLTEPDLTPMVPIHRKVDLRCIPPPEQSVIQTQYSNSVSAMVKGFQGSVDQRFAESVTKLFEQSERTVFLQYAMFRLCEMSINTGGDIRNTFPLVMGELVRQAANLTIESEVETERAKKTLAEADIARSNAEIKRLDCVKAQQERNHDLTAKDIATYCGAPPKEAATSHDSVDKVNDNSQPPKI